MAVSADKCDGRILELGDSGHFVCPPASREIYALARITWCYWYCAGASILRREAVARDIYNYAQRYLRYIDKTIIVFAGSGLND